MEGNLFLNRCSWAPIPDQSGGQPPIPDLCIWVLFNLPNTNLESPKISQLCFPVQSFARALCWSAAPLGGQTKAPLPCCCVLLPRACSAAGAILSSARLRGRRGAALQVSCTGVPKQATYRRARCLFKDRGTCSGSGMRKSD